MLKTILISLKLGAGTAFESVARHYERRELPHTLPCRKLISNFYVVQLTGISIFVKGFFIFSCSNRLIFHSSTARNCFKLLNHHHHHRLTIILTSPCIIILASISVYLNYSGNARRERVTGSSKGLLFCPTPNVLTVLFKELLPPCRYIYACQPKKLQNYHSIQIFHILFGVLFLTFSAKFSAIFKSVHSDNLIFLGKPSSNTSLVFGSRNGSYLL